jgi:hypothetical protein
VKSLLSGSFRVNTVSVWLVFIVMVRGRYAILNVEQVKEREVIVLRCDNNGDKEDVMLI